MAHKNLVEILIAQADRLGDKPSFRFKENGKWTDLSWVGARDQVKEIGLGLKALGVKKGETVVIFASTRVEWTLCDLAVLSIGAVTVPVYHSSTPDQVAYIIENAEAKLAIVENPKLLQTVRKKNPNVRVVQMAGKFNDTNGFTLKQVKEKGRGGSGWEAGVHSIRANDIATYVYTSGTTGNPKGVVLTHRNFMAEVNALAKIFDIKETYSSITFLPLAHIVARALQFFHLKVGYVEAYAESIEKLVDNLGEIRPHFFVAVPRIFEKVYEKVLSQVEAGSPIKKAIFTWATSVGRMVSERKQLKQSISILLKIQKVIATFLVFKKLQNRLGGRLLFAVSGGAPLSKTIGEFFAAAGILVLEGYGLTETTGAVNCNRPDDYKFGTVGSVVEGVTVKLADDGEILVRGPLVFQGYFKRPDATKEVLTEDGWFHTGDIGDIDGKGFLRITDRKKDIIVTAGGKNVAPQNIENLIKTVPYISQVMVHGDKRKFLSALVTLNQDQIEAYAKTEGISYQSYTELIHHPRVYGLVKQAIDEKNKGLASFETIKKFAILEADFSQEAGELTPTLKVKRKFVSEKYKEVLSNFY